jgi:hypothetical protein
VRRCGVWIGAGVVRSWPLVGATKMARIPALWQLCALSEVLLLLLLPHSPVHAAPQPAMAAAPFSAAFVGNSYTFYSDLPSMISSIAEAEGAALSWDANYPGGSALWQHADPDVYGPETEALLARGGWDYIVLQDQSQTPGGGRVTSGAPLGPGEGKVLSISALEEWFAPRLGAARPVLYSTWGRRDGDAANPEIFGTFSEMNHLTTLGCGSPDAAMARPSMSARRRHSGYLPSDSTLCWPPLPPPP